MSYVRFIKDNPVLLLDLLKYVLAALILFGIPVPPGLDVLIAGAVVAVLSFITRSAVTPNGRVDEVVAEAVDVATGGRHRAEPDETSFIPTVR
ncbi:hypothetical protein O7635_29540 [Asanoa sp. WMMD1127]|uniref:hypothetical protein n=1 Tax=Asanoa sp. WMMD1127 TaxID=3016107 RepID=UPI00241722C3|nr:hypothetical protein [Asanoa sp. WMMD1127]MDG4826013.1 hypothetical protein [Asanoa sp. WMMD1127]